MQAHEGIVDVDDSAIVDAPRKSASGIDPRAWPTMFRALREIRPDVGRTEQRPLGL